MKKTIFTVLLTLLTIYANSQIEKGSKLLTLNGMCANINTINGVFNSSLEENKKTLSLGASYSFIQKEFLFGFGLDFAIERNKKFFKNEILNKYYQSEQNTTVSSIILPNIYVGYYKHIFDKLYFTTNLRLGVGAVFYSLNGSTSLFDEEEAGTMISELNQAREIAVLTTVDVKPEFTYFFSKKIGISLYTGGIEYSMAKWNFTSSNLILNFNPNNWLVGLKISI